VAWLVTVAACSALVLRGNLQIYFVGLPGWFMATILYVALSAIEQKRESRAAVWSAGGLK
jgi:hypothetical protein